MAEVSSWGPLSVILIDIKILVQACTPLADIVSTSGGALAEEKVQDQGEGDHEFIMVPKYHIGRLVQATNLSSIGWHRSGYTIPTKAAIKKQQKN